MYLYTFYDDLLGKSWRRKYYERLTINNYFMLRNKVQRSLRTLAYFPEPYYE
jgi:hypothetical protein